MAADLNNTLLERLASAGAAIDEGNCRAELVLPSESGVHSRITAYFLSESMHVIIWDIRNAFIPDIPFDIFAVSGKGRFLSAKSCVRGKCEFSNKEGKSLYLTSGEVAMDYYIDESNSSSFHADDFLCVEVIMQVDRVIEELPTLAMLKQAIKRMDMPDFATCINSLYFISARDGTKRITDELIKYCADGVDRELIVIKASELGHSIGRDLVDSKIKPRTFANRAQARIAEDIHDCLTNGCDKRWTVGYFAGKYGISETSVKNYFRNIYGCGVQEYQRRVRMEKAAALLRETDLTVLETASRVGYHSVSKFREAFITYHGMTPPEYRRNAKIDKAQKLAAENYMTNQKEDQ